MEPEDLAVTAVAIFCRLDDNLPADVELDRVHRALGPKPANPDWPWDVICRIHHYRNKESIAYKAWEAEEIKIDGLAVKILPAETCLAPPGPGAVPQLSLAPRKGVDIQKGPTISYPLHPWRPPGFLSVFTGGSYNSPQLVAVSPTAFGPTGLGGTLEKSASLATEIWSEIEAELPRGAT